MSKPSVYIETTVVSYFVARPSRDPLIAARQRATVEWWDRVLPRCEPFVSAIVIEEVSRGNAEMAARRLKSISEFRTLETTPVVRELAGIYFAACRFPTTARADAYHLALAAGHGVDYLVTWNLEHILAAPVRATVQDINARKGLRTPVICTPEELMEVEG